MFVYLAAVWFVHHKHLAPDLNSYGLPLTAPSPGEARQRLIITSQPGLTPLQGTQK